MIYITFERGGPKFSNTAARALPYRTAMQQNGYYAAEDFFCFREFIKTELATAVQRVFRLRFNFQAPRGRAFGAGIPI
jgi:hypothetical protein